MVLITLWLIFVGAVAIALGGTVVAVVVRILFRPRKTASVAQGPDERAGTGRTIAVGSGAVLVFLLLGAALLGGGSTNREQLAAARMTMNTATPTASSPTSSSLAEAPAPIPEEGTGADPAMVPPGGPASSIAGDGDYMVGADILSGTWMSAGGSKCMWARTKYSDGGHPNPYYEHHVNAHGVQTARIRKRDAVFRTWGCGSWQRIDS
jgi:hypothetical protein